MKHSLEAIDNLRFTLGYEVRNNSDLRCIYEVIDTVEKLVRESKNHTSEPLLTYTYHCLSCDKTKTLRTKRNITFQSNHQARCECGHRPRLNPTNVKRVL